MNKVVINTRILSSHTTGVQRYTKAIITHLPGKLMPVSPTPTLSGTMGHLWEQGVLPRLLSGKLLFSPSNTGPITVSRQIVVIHDIAPLEHPEWYNPRFAALYRFLLPRLARSVRGVITDSAFTRSRLIQHLNICESKVSVVPLGVEPRYRPIAETEIKRAIISLGLPSVHYVLTLGSLEPRKNLKRLLAAWKEIEGQIPDDIWLVIAGAKGKRHVFQELLLNDLPPRVHLAGYVPEESLPALISGALGFVYVSLYEGFGLPPLEAMASGTPVVVGNRTSLPEVVGNAGLLVDPYDIESISHGLVTLIENRDLREKLSSLGLKRAKLFSWDRTAKSTWALLSRALED